MCSPSLLSPSSRVQGCLLLSANAHHNRLLAHHLHCYVCRPYWPKGSGGASLGINQTNVAANVMIQGVHPRCISGSRSSNNRANAAGAVHPSGADASDNHRADVGGCDVGAQPDPGEHRGYRLVLDVEGEPAVTVGEVDTHFEGEYRLCVVCCSTKVCCVAARLGMPFSSFRSSQVASSFAAVDATLAASQSADDDAGGPIGWIMNILADLFKGQVWIGDADAFRQW